MIKISFSREDLLSHSPCDPGLDLFDRCFPSGEANFDLTPFSFVLICQSGFAGWLIEKGLLASVSLEGVDLRAADLRLADLRSADLYSANLSSAVLRLANLSAADLSLADLSLADLSAADLSSADLSSADLRLADLSSADLSDALRYPSDPEIPGWTVVDGRLKRLC